MGKSNVNKDHYIGAHGRERQGEDVVQKIHKQQLREEKKKNRQEFREDAEDRKEQEEEK